MITSSTLKIIWTVTLTTEIMQFQVTEIEFDFESDDDFPEHEFSNITDETIGMIWEADDEDDLIEEITCATGWCIKSIDYRIILNWNSWLKLHSATDNPGQSLMLTMKIVSTMITWLRMIMMRVVMNVTGGMSPVTIHKGSD